MGRYDGPLKVIGFDPSEPMNFMQGEMFVNAPADEPWSVSTRRLINAMRSDGIRELRPTTIWLTYRRHKELSEHEL